LLVDARDGDAFGTSLSSASEAVVLSMPTRHGSDERIEAAALGWAAEHAFDLGADPQLLLLAGVRVGGGHAAGLAIAAGDQGWPGLHRQLLVHPAFDETWALPSEVAGTAPATIVTCAPADVHVTRYAARLHAAGVEVDELRVPDGALPSGGELDELVRSLRLGAADERATGRRSYQTGEPERRHR
jgi:acetyl esterase/lipase